MPKQVLPLVADFQIFERKLLKLGFHSITSQEFRRGIRGLESPRFRPGREAGFIYAANGLEVCVWTTWLRGEDRARDVDSGWVLIRKGRDVLYFSRPLHRTKNFLQNLFCWARVTQLRVQHRPHCPGCNELMQIVRGRGLKQRYWRCDLVHRHSSRKPESRSWDVGLTPLAQQWVNEQRTRRATSTYKAMLARKLWVVRKKSSDSE